MLNHWITRSARILDCVDSSQIRANRCPAHLPWRRPHDLGQPPFCAPGGQRGRRGRLGAVVALGRTVGARCFPRFPKRLLGRASPAPAARRPRAVVRESGPSRCPQAAVQRPRQLRGRAGTALTVLLGACSSSRISGKDHTEPFPSSAWDWCFSGQQRRPAVDSRPEPIAGRSTALGPILPQGCR